LVHLRKGEPFAEVAAGFGVSTTTCWRYVNETVELLAQRAPKLRQALRTAHREGMAYVVLDGTLIPIDRVAADRPFYSGKHQMHGMNLQVIASPDGTILWVSGDLPGSTHDTAAARIWMVLAALRDAWTSSAGTTLLDSGNTGDQRPGQHQRGDAGHVRGHADVRLRRFHTHDLVPVPVVHRVPTATSRRQFDMVPPTVRCASR